jgi:transglutaminase-like putative cysteine protease
VARTLLVSAVPAGVIAAAWLRFESPHDSLRQVLALVALALAVPLVRPLWARLAALLVSLGLVARLAFGLSPLDARPFDAHHAFFFGPLGSRFANGFLDFYDVRLPFDPRLHAEMGGVVLVAVFAFTLAVAGAVAARRPVVAALALLVGAGWPATLVGNAGALVQGTAILLAALVVLAGLTTRHVPRVVVPASAALAVVALAASSTAAVAKPGVVAWQRWDFYNAPIPPVSVQFVWDGRYGGIHFPKKKTTVLEVQAPRAASLYWRAAVLDEFGGTDWTVVAPRPGDGLEPPDAYRRAFQTRQVVTVKALADTRLVGGSAPIAYDAGDAPIVRLAPGFAFLPAGLTRGFRYTVWSYAPQPTAAQLDRSPANYPGVLTAPGSFLDVWPDVTVPAFGTTNRAQRMTATLDANPETLPYRALQHVAEQVAGRARTPYRAAVTLEAWFRAPGRFHYSDHPPVDTYAPLVSFVAQTHTGYCQHFAGAMALMLRYLGVPARVAVGFSSGTYDGNAHAWIVTDHDAHAWVEAWFAGYGWLPFDPTPSANRPEQGVLSAGYSASSPRFDGGAVTGGPGPPAVPPQQAFRHGESGAKTHPGSAGGETAAAPAGHGNHLGLLLLLALLALGAAAALAVVKVTLRRTRFLTHDPRRVAGACRRELADFLLDQRIEAARSATLHELGALVRHELAVDADRFVAAASAARFGPPAGAPAAAKEARRELRRLVRDVRARLSGRERLRGLLSLRSLGFSG